MLQCGRVPGATLNASVISIAQQKGGSGKTTLAAHLASAFSAAGKTVAVIDTDPQESLTTWARDRAGLDNVPGVKCASCSSWGLRVEINSLKDEADLIIVDTPPRADSDIRSTLRASDLVLVPVSSSLLDLWATPALLEQAEREGAEVRLVLNRVRAGTRMANEIVEKAGDLGAAMTETSLGNRVCYAELIGRGLGVHDRAGNKVAREEIGALVSEIDKILK